MLLTQTQSNQGERAIHQNRACNFLSFQQSRCTSSFFHVYLSFITLSLSRGSLSISCNSLTMPTRVPTLFPSASKNMDFRPTNTSTSTFNVSFHFYMIPRIVTQEEAADYNSALQVYMQVTAKARFGPLLCSRVLCYFVSIISLGSACFSCYPSCQTILVFS